VKTIKKHSDSSALFDQVERLRRLVEGEGIKLTPQRLEIFRELSIGDNHPSAETLYRKLKKKMPTMSLDTVYRTLAVFERLGLISRVHILDDHSRFDMNTGRHHHFVCTECRRLVDFTWPDFDRMSLPAELKEFGRATFCQVEVRGVCADCLERKSQRGGEL